MNDLSRRSDLRWIGRPLPRPDAEDKVTGRARYADDLALSGMLHGYVIRSVHPHARIRHIDLDPVNADPSVVCTVTADDIPGDNVVPVIFDDQPALARDGIVRYVGEPIALVVAVSRRAAQRAAANARVDYEPLPTVADPMAALESDAPAVAVPEAAQAPPNVFTELHIDKGDTDQAFSIADVVVEGEYRTGYQEHAYLEPQGAIAVPEELGAMAIYGSMQCPFYVQKSVSRVLGLPYARVRIVHTTTGGAFGGKEEVPSLICCLAALMAFKSGRPVKLVLDRAEDILTTSKRHPSIVHYRTAARRDGTLLAVDVDYIFDSGAYQTLSPAVLWRGLLSACGPYRIPNVRIRGRSVATNTVPCGAFRGFGSPQLNLAHESQMDRVAHRLGIDRLQIRKMNALREGDETASGQILTESVGITQTLTRAAELAGAGSATAAVTDTAPLSDWAVRQRPSAPDRRRGIGISSVMYGVGLGGRSPFLDKAGAYVKLEADGSVSIAVGTVEMGQGLIAALTQAASESLELPSDRISILPVDSSRVPDSGPTVASRGTIMSALAIQDATSKLRTRIKDVANQMSIPHDEIPARLPEIAAQFWLRNLDPATEGWSSAQPVTWDDATGRGDAYAVYAFATHIAEVEIDTSTGEVSIERFIAVHDSGTVLNRQMATGQVEGGIAQGIGLAVMEEIPQVEGKLIVNGFTTYRIPTIRDVAPDTQVDFVETYWSAGPFGAKGLGEVPLMASHGAVARAIADALGDCEPQMLRYPLSPERIKTILARPSS
ncbi:xanthine dehydrogenase family protein [Candidatus Bipolaricaulota bacterium]|nr:xanthine dehydrogenase family protein [Candidatus Bipolaricaulota bacterium]